MSNASKQAILDKTLQAKQRNEALAATLSDSVSLLQYRHLVRQAAEGEIWTDALQAALDEHEIITIPASDTVYWLDRTIIIPSNRRIEADGAVMRLVPDYPYIMLRNAHTHDGTHAPIDTSDRDRNITILGGRWEECSTGRGLRGYGDPNGGFCGVQTCMLFNNLDHLTMIGVTFSHAMSFSVQVGDLTDGVFENFRFDSCFADGLHINGNCENLYIRDFSGQVGDDLVALNMYDWLGSSINYGPAKTVFCENLYSAPGSGMKALRLLPGTFVYDDGTAVDCSLQDIYIRRVRGVYEYKLYLQTPPYAPGETPESGGTGSADNIFYEDIDIVSERPDYPVDAPVTGYFGMFFFNSKIGRVSLHDIRYTQRPEESPRTYLIAAGPMTWKLNGKEVFDPYISGYVEQLELENITVNGKRVEDINQIVKVIAFDDVNHDGFSTGKGEIRRILLDGKVVSLSS